MPIDPRQLLPQRPFDRFHGGERRLPKEKLNAAMDALEALQTGINPPAEVIGAGRAKLIAQRFQVTSVEGDYLICEYHNGFEAKGGAVKIAKPWLLRRTPFDGKTRNGVTYTYTDAQNRTGDDGSQEAITPAYVAGDQIVAVKGIAGGTGVNLASPAPETVEWEDVNEDGRTWGGGGGDDDWLQWND